MDGNRTKKRLRQMVVAAALHFALVFACGFLRALVRVPWLEPRLGQRSAELLEMPLMLLVILWSSRRMVRRWTEGTRATRLGAGLLALALLIATGLGLAFALDGLDPIEYVETRDPVSGSAYALCLLIFSLGPAVVPTRGHHSQGLQS